MQTSLNPGPWTLAALLYGALIEALGFGPAKHLRRMLPRFVIDDMVRRVRPFEALVRRLLFTQAQTISITLRPRARIQTKLQTPPPAPVTQYVALPHDPLAFRRTMLGQGEIVRLCPAHPLDGAPASWKHVRFNVGAGAYPPSATAGVQPSVSRADKTASSAAPAARRRSRGGARTSPCVPWYKLTAAEKDARRHRRAARNVAAEMKRDRAEALAAAPAPEQVLTAHDLAQISTIAIARRLEALARVIGNPAPYAKRVARKLAQKPALAACMSRRVTRRATRHVSDAFRAGQRWLDAECPVVRAPAMPCPDSS